MSAQYRAFINCIEHGELGVVYSHEDAKALSAFHRELFHSGDLVVLP